MKNIITILAIALISIKAKAQSGYNYYEYSAGIDLQHYNGNEVIGFNIGYNVNPYLPVSLQIETGTHTAAVFIGDYQFGNILNSNNPLKNLYIGAGFGASKAAMLISLRFGYEFKINDQYREPSVAIAIGYVHLTGINQTRVQIGFKYYLGHLRSFKKLI